MLPFFLGEKEKLGKLSLSTTPCFLWALKNWCFSTVVLEKTLESPLDYKEIQPVHSEGDQPWDFCGRNDATAETPVLWPPHEKTWLIGKDSDAGRDWGQEEKGTTEDEMAGWHYWVDGRESEWTPGFGDGQGGLACCDSWGRKESDTTEQLIWSDLMFSRGTGWCRQNETVFVLFLNCYSQVSLFYCVAKISLVDSRALPDVFFCCCLFVCLWITNCWSKMGNRGWGLLFSILVSSLQKCFSFMDYVLSHAFINLFLV